MIFHPTIIALLTGSVLTSAMLVYACFYGARIIKGWDIDSGTEHQLNLERRTYLISTLVNYAFGFQLLSLFLFIYTADSLSSFFVGAMCAAGSLYVNEWGYPAIILKTSNAVLAGLWLTLNFTDNRAYDYPLIRIKYALLITITPLILVEMIVQGNYFLRLKPEVITSCCGALFSGGSETMIAGIVSLPFIPGAAFFFSAMGMTFFSGIYVYFTGRWGYVFSLMSLITFFASITALIAFVSLYFYELPTHHCPFCILQKEYMYVGYPIYITILLGVITGVAAGVIHVFRNIQSLAEVIPSLQRKLVVVSLVSYGIYLAIVIYAMVFSNLSLLGY